MLHLCDGKRDTEGLCFTMVFLFFFHSISFSEHDSSVRTLDVEKVGVWAHFSMSMVL